MELHAIENHTLSIVSGEIKVDSQTPAVFGSAILIDSEVTQTGSGHVVLNGQARKWTVRDAGLFSGSGSVSHLIVAPSATFSPGMGTGTFRIGDQLDLHGTLLIDVLPHRDLAADLDLVQAAQVVLASTSQLRFQVRHNPTDVPNPLNPQATGRYSRTIISSPVVTGQFGSMPGADAHLSNGVFFKNAATSAAGQSFDVSLFQAFPGDSNGRDGFGTADLILVFTAGQYEDSIIGNSNWLSGDWNHDGDFTTADLIAAFQAGFFDPTR
jgi:hypothetical protein